MAGADFPAVLCIVIKVLVSHDPVLITDETVSFYLGRIKFHLELNIFGNREKGSSHLFHQHLPGLSHAVYVGVLSVSVIRQGLHLVILDIPGPKSQDG